MNVSKVPAVVPRLVFEPTSPFVVRSKEDREVISSNDHDPQQRPIFLELLADPSAIVARIADPEAIERLILTSIATLIGSSWIFSMIVSSTWGAAAMLRAASLTSLSGLLALAAAFGPIYAASLLLAARIPLARLVAIIVSSAATGSLILAAISPIPLILLRLDPAHWGPLVMMGAFLLGGLISGARLHRSMFLLAETMFEDRVLTPDAKYRVGILARVSWMLVGFTLGLGLWGFDGLL